MVGRTTLKNYGFESISQYYQMIIDSYLSGQKSQALKQFKKLNRDQRAGFLEYMDDKYSFLEEIKDFLIRSL